MTRAAILNQQRMQWGQRQTYQPPWENHEARPLLTLDRVNRPFPISKTIILSLDDTSPPTFGAPTYIYRWRMTVGVGGGTATFVFDASRLQQVALPAETLRLELLCETPRIGGFGFVYDSPEHPAIASAFIADLPTSTSPAMYSQHVSVALGTEENIIVPNGATGLLIGPSDDRALQSTSRYTLVGNSGETQFWNGTELTPLNARIEPIPVPGAARFLRIQNGGVAGDITCWTHWLLDL